MGASYSIDIIADESTDFVQYMNSGVFGVVDRRIRTRVILSGKLSSRSTENFEPLHFADYRRAPFPSEMSSVIVDREEAIVFSRPGTDLFGASAGIGKITNPEIVSNYVNHFEMLWDASKTALYQDLDDEAKTIHESSIITSITDFEESLLVRLRQDPGLLHALQPRQFEEVVQHLLRKLGHETTLTPATKDGGYDLLSTYKTPSGISILCLVECKRYAPERPVGVNWVRSLYGLVEQHRANMGMVVTTSRFTSGAQAFQKDVGYRMDLREFKDLSNWINQTTK